MPGAPGLLPVLDKAPQPQDGQWEQSCHPFSSSVTKCNSWAGYEVTQSCSTSSCLQARTSYTGASGAFTQPTLVDAGVLVPPATDGVPGYDVKDWVGVGSSGDGEGLEQVGTEAAYGDDGQAYYEAWYEFFPAPLVKIPIDIAPGDAIEASVIYEGQQGPEATSFRISIEDMTRGEAWSRVLTDTQPAGLDGAEWIAEPQSLSADSAAPEDIPETTPLSWSSLGLTASDENPAHSLLIAWSLYDSGSQQLVAPEATSSSSDGFTEPFWVGASDPGESLEQEDEGLPGA